MPLFETPSSENSTIQDIAGLTYIPDYINNKLQNRLLEVINQQSWRGDLKRRVQHYGYVYDYKSRGINPNMYLGELPKFCQYFAEKFYEEGLFGAIPDQVIVNEYEPGQGIADHVDCQPCFEDTVISMSLGSACVMNFTNVQNPSIVLPQILKPKSIVVLKEAARYHWKHGIKARKTDMIEGKRVARGTRISLTFRKVILK
ncbi:MAG: alpha-ketoglutarate-dependent dioxygenase AlkB [Chitinophagales bacterium]